MSSNKQPFIGPDSVTKLLANVKSGVSGANAELYRVVYSQLVGIADRQLFRSDVATLNANDLVHEAFVKLQPSMDTDWNSRSHFYGVAAKAMRQILVDYARRRSSLKRGGDQVRVTLEGLPNRDELQLEDFISINDSLDRLNELNPRLRKVVEMRFFAGMPEEAIADALGVSARTVERDWVKAKMFLHQDLFPELE